MPCIIIPRIRHAILSNSICCNTLLQSCVTALDASQGCAVPHKVNGSMLSAFSCAFLSGRRPRSHRRHSKSTREWLKAWIRYFAWVLRTLFSQEKELSADGLFRRRSTGALHTSTELHFGCVSLNQSCNSVRLCMQRGYAVKARCGT